MTLSWSQPGKAAPTSNDYDPEGSRPNVEESANELKRMRFGRQTASSMLQSSQMAIRQMQDISFEEEREEDIERRGEGAPKKKKNQGCVGEWTSYITLSSVLNKN